MSESMIQMQRKLADVTSKLENAEGEIAKAQATLARLAHDEKLDAAADRLLEGGE